MTDPATTQVSIRLSEQERQSLKLQSIEAGLTFREILLIGLKAVQQKVKR